MQHEIAFEPISCGARDFVAAIRAHYTGSAGAPPGKKQAWRVWIDEHIIGHIGVGEPSYKLAPRRRLGLEDARPLPRTVCCFIFRRVDPISPGRPHGSSILKLWHHQAEADWEARYGWCPEHWETLVSPMAVQSSNPGACFLKAGYRALGMTTGRGARRPPGSTHDAPRVWSDGVPKLVLYRGPLPRVDPSQR
jgi:hypothetical protein